VSGVVTRWDTYQGEQRVIRDAELARAKVDEQARIREQALEAALPKTVVTTSPEPIVVTPRPVFPKIGAVTPLEPPEPVVVVPRPVFPKIAVVTPTVPTPKHTSVPEPGPRDIMDEASFEVIDHHALSAPRSVGDSIESLVAYLVGPTKNDLEKVRVIYRWITENISYDVSGYLTGNYGDLSPEGVLTRGSAVCSGYAGLFGKLAATAGLDVVEIGGWAKGISYKVGDRISGPTNHAWNAVKISDGWYLIDSTWGAGSVDGLRFVRRFEEHYFLTPPNEFIYDHFPENSDWQMLKNPVSRQDFAEMLYLRPAFFRNGLEIGNRAQSTVQTEYQIAITLAAPAGVLLSAEVEQDARKLPRSLVFVQREGKQYQINAVFPFAGDYILRVFVKNEADKGNEYSWALDYAIKANEGLPGSIGFPETYGNFQAEQVYLYTPKTRYLQSGTIQNFKLIVPRAEKVAIIMGEQWIQLQKTGDLFEGNASIVQGEIRVSAQFPNEAIYWALLNYTGL